MSTNPAVELNMDDMSPSAETGNGLGTDAQTTPPQSEMGGKERHNLKESGLQVEHSTKELLPDPEAGRPSENGTECFRERLMKKRHVVSVAANMQSFIGEFIGTFILVTAITTSVTLAAIAGQLTGLWQVAVLIAIGLGLAIFVSAHISDAHLNPAVTVAFAIVRFKVFSWKKIPIYIVAQMLGGFFAAAVMYGFYHGAIESFEDQTGLERGSNGSERSAMVFGEYFPNPAAFDDNSIVSTVEAFFIEAWGTAVLVFVIFVLTDKHNTTVGSGNNKVVVPMLIGLTLGFLVAMYGSLTQAGYNPARDFGPRLFAAIAGWGRIAIPGPRNGFWLYIVAPLIGGPIGAAIHDLGVANIMRLKRFVKPRQQA